MNFQTAKAPAPVTKRNLKTANRERVKSLAGRLKDIPAAELQEMILAAGLDAMTAALDSRGSITLPLKLSVTRENAMSITHHRN